MENALGPTTSRCRGRAQRRRAPEHDVPGTHKAHEWRIVCQCGYTSAWKLNITHEQARIMYKHHRMRVKEGYRG